ncbi:hypothetical protein ACFLKB_14445 [Clostridium sp. FAM 1755]|uniref:hypothetical protein n=1 Tax=Clostridium TaxID=1485 RepID=UPI0006ABE48D|nr:hypothetical protein [Clostridium sp. L74]KOR26794.1 hypothetical protein ND00_03210 [Clostridium sp. L74]
MEDILNNLKWEGNSKRMYEVILKAVPKVFQGTINSLVANWIINNKVEIVTEDIVFQAVEYMAPSEAKNKLLPILNQMKTIE